MDESEMTNLRADACDGEVPIERGQPESMEKRAKVPGSGDSVWSRRVSCRLPVLLALGLAAVVLLVAAVLLARHLPRRGGADGPNHGAGGPAGLLRGRLPGAVLPRRYELRLRPFLYEEDAANSGRPGRRFTFDGWLRLTVECLRPTHEITLHAKNLSLHRRPAVTARAGPAGARADLSVGYWTVEEHSFLVLELDRALSPHQLYDIHFEYSGLMQDDEAGFYPSSYVDATSNTRYIAISLLAFTHARRVYPCFDEPSFKASYDVQLEHRTDMAALSNGMETGTVPLDGHWSRTTFASVHSMPSFLMAFIVHDFASINVTNDHGCLIRVWCQPDLVRFAPFALNVSEAVQTYFDVYLDSQYPLLKQDHVAVADLAPSAMENWGLITYRDVRLLHGMEGSMGRLWRTTALITHELAHQWFGNLATEEWWDDLWLSEGFATYFQHIGMEIVHPEINKYANTYTHNTAMALWIDSLGSYPSLRAPVNTSEATILAKVSMIVYQKGASLLVMLEHFLTLEVFNRGIRSYLKEHAYKNANTEHLWRELTEADKHHGKRDVKAIMDTWSLQRGYPLVTLTRTGNDIQATQEIFLEYGKEQQLDKYGHLGYKWYVPLTYMYKSGASDQFDRPRSVWLDPANDTTTFSLPSGTPAEDWYLANARMTGFYRVNYDPTNWQRLVDQMEQDPEAIDQVNRMGLLHDAAALVLTERLDLAVYLALAESLAFRTVLDRETVLRTMGEVAVLMEDDGENQTFWRRSTRPSPMEEYMQRLVEPLYADHGWDVSFVPDLSATRWRKGPLDITWTACRYGNQHCINRATTQFKEYMDYPDVNTIPPNFRKVVYCYGVRLGGRAEWEFALAKLQTPSNDHSERSRWISALSCSVDTERLQSCLELMQDSKSFTRRDIQLLLIGMASNADGYEVAWDFVRQNWEDTVSIFRGRDQLLGDLLGEIAFHFRSEEELQQLLDLGRTRSLGALQAAYGAAITTAKGNIKWKGRSAGKLKAWTEATRNNQ